MDITYKDYSQADSELLKSLSRELESYIKNIDPIRRIKNLPGFSELSIQETLESVRRYNGKIWFALHKDEVVGFVIGVIWEQSEKNKLEIGPHILGEVLDLYVKETYRRNGIGKQMLQKMEDYFKSQNCDSMWVSVFAPNENAHALYRTFGFQDREIGMLKEI